jgi:hypothetical protein
MAKTSVKRILIDKANSTILIIMCVALALLIFSLFSARSLFKQASFRSRVIKEKRETADTMKANDRAIGELIESFKTFDSAPESVIGTTDKNSKIVLDALPSQYDFPALATSLEKILTDGGYDITGISGVDNELGEVDDRTATPEPIEIPFNLSLKGDSSKARSILLDLERTIRPIHILNLSINGSDSDLRININAKTYYQPGKSLEVTKEEVK